MKTLRETFEENYMAVEEPCNNKKGFRIRYVYTGVWYGWGAEDMRRRKRLLAALCACGVSLLLLGGMIDSPLNAAGIVQIPAMLALAAAVFEAFGVIQFCAAKERISKMDFDDVNTKLRAASLLHAALLWFAAAAGAFLLVTGDYGWRDAAVPLLFCLSAVSAFILWLRYRELPQKKTKNEAAKAALARQASPARKP